jgi:uncharacterized delta-60 repeat protein
MGSLIGRRWVRLAVVGILILVAFGGARPTPVVALDGDLDPSFGPPATAGRVITPIGSGPDEINTVRILPDGKILVAGCANCYAGDGNFAVARYNADGSPDTSFDFDGLAVTSFGGSEDAACALAIQPDGKILVAGDIYTFVDSDWGIARLNPDGSPDTTFGGGTGRTQLTIGQGLDFLYGIVVQSDGRIVVGGSALIGGTWMFALARVQANGVLDPTFGQGGKRITPIGAAPTTAHAMAVQADGKILLAGESGAGEQTDFAVARYTPDGHPDPSFGGSGVLTTQVGGLEDAARALLVQRDGRILVAGFAQTQNAHDFAVVRYCPDGRLDDGVNCGPGGFGSGGMAIQGFGDSSDEAEALVEQGDGKILVAGKAGNAFGVMKLHPSGGLDAGFGAGGKRTTGMGGNNAGAEGMALQWDGKVVLAGTTGLDFALARYLNTIPAGCLPQPPAAPQTFTPTFRVFVPGVAAGPCAAR